MEQRSAVGVLDKAVAVLEALSAGPLDLTGLCARTALPRATAHRLAGALELHRLVGRSDSGAYVLGPRLAELADPFTARAGPVLAHLSLRRASASRS
jgi:DNA-binding IclR family transcriptional regulator